jgi:hypothetical protein
MKLIVWQHRGRILCVSRNLNIEWHERKYKTVKQRKASVTEEYHPLAIEENR